MIIWALFVSTHTNTNKLIYNSMHTEFKHKSHLLMFLDTVIDIVDTPSPQRMQGPPSTLQYRDVLMLFESDVTDETPMVTCLIDRGMSVQVISSRDQESVLQDDHNSVLVAKAGFLYGLKRKVVVYVEGHPSVDKRSEFYSKWNRLRGITSCTSQLIFIRMSWNLVFLKMLTIWWIVCYISTQIHY